MAFALDLEMKNIQALKVKIGLLEKNGVIIIETDEKERELKELEKLQVEVYDLRKYGRVNLIFLNRKEQNYGNIYFIGDFRRHAR